ncbi:MAG: Ku protein, partial [Candidatus Scatosoma sp.]
EYKDEYRERVQAAIESKIAGKEIVSPKENKNGNPADLMDALMKSLSVLQTPETKKKPPEIRKAQRRKAQ